MSAAEEAYQKTLAGAYRRHRFVPSRFTELRRTIRRFSSYMTQSKGGGGGGGGGGSITYMMIADEDAALFGGAHRALTFLQPAVDQQGRYRAPCPNIGASIEGLHKMSRIRLCEAIFQTSAVPWIGLAGSSTSWSRNHWNV